jgi:hypothetical protein
MLDETDFEEDGVVGNPAVFGKQKPEHASYMTQMARAARLRMDTMKTRLGPLLTI